MSAAREIPLAPCPGCGCGLVPTIGGGTWCPQCNTTRSSHGDLLVSGYGPPAPTKRRDSSLAVAGYVFAILLPIVGFVIAIVLFARDEVGPGIATLLMSIAMFALAAAAVGLL